MSQPATESSFASHGIAAEKKALRVSVLAAREAMPAEARAREGATVCARVAQLPAYRDAPTVLAYVSFGAELDTHALLRQVLADGKALALPRVVKSEQRLSLHRIASLDTLQAGPWGILEPPADASVFTLAQAAFILVPGVAFDLAGFRLGYGAGYYDRLLALANPDAARVSLAFQCQMVDAVPNAPHDQRVDAIITSQQNYLIEHDRKNH
jgi:5,10-methenyltetrahydrofolate synthetase